MARELTHRRKRKAATGQLVQPVAPIQWCRCDMRLHGRTGGEQLKKSTKRRDWAFAKGGVGLLVTIRRVGRH